MLRSLLRMGQGHIHEQASSEETKKDCQAKETLIGIKLFIYTLSKTTVNFRMVSNVLPIPPAHNEVIYQTWVSESFLFKWFLKQFSNDYLANYMTGVEATKVRVYNSCYHNNAQKSS